MQLPEAGDVVAVPHLGTTITDCVHLLAFSHDTLPISRSEPNIEGAGYRFYHLHQVAGEDDRPGPGDWAVCYDLRGDYRTYDLMGVGQCDLDCPNWFEGEGLNWMYEGRKIVATTDPQLIALGVTPMSQAQRSDFVAQHYAYPTTKP